MGRIITRRGALGIVGGSLLAGCIPEVADMLSEGHPFDYPDSGESAEGDTGSYAYKVDWVGRLKESSSARNMLGEQDGEYARFDGYVELVAFFREGFDRVYVGMTLSENVYMAARSVVDVTTYLSKMINSGRWYEGMELVLNDKYLADPNRIVRGGLTRQTSHFEQPINLETPEKMIYVGFDDTDINGNRRGAEIAIDYIRAE